MPVASRVERLSEAFIGLIYAFGIATVFLILSKSPQGTEDFQRLLANDLLFVSMKEIYQTTGIYFLIGIALYLTGKFFKNRLKDISFFLLFAITVTSSSPASRRAGMTRSKPHAELRQRREERRQDEGLEPCRDDQEDAVGELV